MNKPLQLSFNSFLKQIPVSHLPTLLLLIGYPVFWLEMYFLKNTAGMSSLFATGAFLILSLGVIYFNQKTILTIIKSYQSEFSKLAGFLKCIVFLICGISGVIVLIAFMAALLPPHLMQEYDALNYHITIPRQHLILNSFAHIAWSTADLFLLPIQFALSPYWLVTELPNKFPQFIFLIGLVLTSMSLIGRIKKDFFWPAVILAAAILATHGYGIQMGTAMLDLVLLYLLVAAIDSLLRGNVFLAALEFSFYFWSKSFIPVQTIFIIIALIVLRIVFNKFSLELFLLNQEGAAIIKSIKQNLKKFCITFVILSFFIGGPFVVKSLYYASTPLYPFSVGAIKVNPSIDTSSLHWQSLVASEKSHMISKDSYGSKRTLIEFIKHFWLVAVPEEVVNNRFDYPLGLSYLLFIVPFLFLFGQSLKEKRFSVLGWTVVVFWLSWWFGSQQSRFLFVPLLLMYLLVIIELKTFSKVLLGMLIMALGFNMLSIFGAHKNDLTKSSMDVLRDKDKKTLELNRIHLPSMPIYLDYNDAPFARVPIEVTKEKLPYVLQIPSAK